MNKTNKALKKKFKFNIGTILIRKSEIDKSRIVKGYNIEANSYILLSINTNHELCLSRGFFERHYDTEKFLRKTKPELF